MGMDRRTDQAETVARPRRPAPMLRKSGLRRFCVGVGGVGGAGASAGGLIFTDQEFDPASVGLTASQTLFDGGSIRARIE